MKTTTNRGALTLVLAFALCACAPPDVSGTYTGAITNRDNGCMLSNFNPGAMTTGINMNVNQSGSTVTVAVEGLAGLALAAFTGNTEPMRGSTTVNGFSVSKTGTIPMNVGGCTFNTFVQANATLSGNTLNGTVTYSYQTTNAEACDYRATCRTEQSFSFVRPPR